MLHEIQSRLKVPKSHYNDFGKYHYRSLDDIIEAVKPILYEMGLSITFTEEIQVHAGMPYVRSTATLWQGSSSLKETSVAVREPIERKGMVSSQITASTISYARKYAIAGLLLLDDSQDIDAQNFSDGQAPAGRPISAKTPQGKPLVKQPVAKPAHPPAPSPEDELSDVKLRHELRAYINDMCMPGGDPVLLLEQYSRTTAGDGSVKAAKKSTQLTGKWLKDTLEKAKRDWELGGFNKQAKGVNDDV